MTETPDDKVFIWFFNKIYDLSRWSNNPFDIPVRIGWGHIDGDHVATTTNILSYLQDDAGVLKYEIFTPLLQHPFRENEYVEGDRVYRITVLPQFDEYSKSLHTKSNLLVTARLELRHESLMLNIGHSSYLLKKYRLGSPLLAVMSYLLQHPNKEYPFRRAIGESELDPDNFKYPASEFVRISGFKSELLKDLFFPIRDAGRIKLINPVDTTATEAEKITGKLTDS